MEHKLKMVSEDVETFTVGGMAVIFGGKDLVGDTFSRQTDFMVKNTNPNMPVFYDHAQGSIKNALGKAVSMTMTDAGIWMEAQIERSKEYAREVLELVKDGRLGYSTGSVSHLVERMEGMIKRWPIVELSITPTPAEPRTLGIEFLKSIGIDTEAQGVKPEAEQVGKVLSADNATKTKTRIEIMNEEEKRQAEIDAAVKSALAKKAADEKAAADAVKAKQDEADAMKARVNQLVEEALKAATETKGGILTAPAIKKETKLGGDHDGGDAFKHWVRTGRENYYTRDQRPEWKEPEAGDMKAAYQEGTAVEGGVLVPKDLYTRIIAKRDEASIPHRAGALVINTSKSSIQLPSENATAAFTLTAEEAAVTQSEGTLLDDTVTVYKWSALSKASTELLEDQEANLEQWMGDMWGRAAAAVYNQYTLIGTGSGQPEGVFVGGTAGSTFAGTGAITAAELVALYHKLPADYTDGARWVTRHATLGLLRALTGNPFAFNPTPQGNQANGELYGHPVDVSDQVPAIATAVKSIAIVNWNFYALVERAGMTVTRNPYLYQANDQVGFFARIRWGGMCSVAESIQYGTQA